MSDPDPDVPTIAEAGLPGYRFETWFMAFAPAGTPKALVGICWTKPGSGRTRPTVAPSR